MYNNAQDKTGAHELGHGIFKLEHPWKVYETTQSVTPLLMDYSTGEELSHLDWKQINDPAFKLYAFQSQSSGEFTNYVITPDFRIVSIQQSSTLTFDKNNKNIPTGTCSGFVTYKYNEQNKKFENIKYYLWDNGKYVNSSDSKDTITPSTVTPNSESLVTLFYNYGDCPGGILDLKYSAISDKYNSAQGLLSIISEHQSEAKALKCVSFSSTTEDPKGKGWTQAELGVSLNCNADNIKELLKNEIANINAITNSTTAEQTNLILKQNYKDCVFANIDIDKRITILDNLLKDNVDDSQWEFSNGILSLGDTFFLDDLILSTPQNDRLKLLKDGFMKNNYKWLEILFNKSKGITNVTNNDSTMTEIVPLFRGIASWVATYYPQLNIPTTMETMVDIGPSGFSSYEYPVASINPVYLGASDDGSGLFDFVEIKDGIKYKPKIIGNTFIQPQGNKFNFTYSLLKTVDGTYITAPNTTPKDFSENYSLSVHPFEPVIMIASRNYLNLGIEKGKEYTVPAFLAASYEQFILDDASDESARSLGNAIAITAAIITIPQTGGGSYYAYLTLAGGAVSSVDVALKNDRLKLNQDAVFKAKYESYYQAWDIFYSSVLLADAGANVYNLANNLRKVNLVRSTKNFYTKMKDFDFNGELMNVWKGLRGIENITLNLTDELKLTYSELTKVGLKAKEEAGAINFYDSNNVLLAQIKDNKFITKKWITAYKNELIQQTSAGYKLVKNEKGVLGFDIGFKDGRVLKAEEFNEYYIAIGRNDPYRQGTPIIERYLQKGDKVYVVENKIYGRTGKVEPNPGSWGSKNAISTEKELREYLAVLEDWKKAKGIDDALVLREYTVIEPLPVRDGVVGPQMDKFSDGSYKVYYGGEHQYEFIAPLFDNGWEKYLKPKSFEGIILK